MLDTLYNNIRNRMHVPPGLVVLMVVLVLLYGVGGAVAAVVDMAVALLAAILGGGDHDAVASVLWRTLPLALAAAGVTFAACNGWLKLDSLHSYVWMALIVLAGAVVGNACYEKFGSQVAIVAGPGAGAATVVQPIGLPETAVASQSLVETLKLTPTAGIAAIPAPVTAWQRLTGIHWLKQPDLSRKPRPVEPLKLVPKGPGIYGGVGGAINQLLGYLVDYEPRLFLASIIAGSFMGWRLQRRVVVAHAVVSGDFSELTDREARRLAA